MDGDDEVIFVVGDTGAKAQKDNETNTKYYEYQAHGRRRDRQAEGPRRRRL